ncbi:ABC-2 type transport system permease protein [Leucobacter luti]|uniref:ABC transporter permease n=1 Tax=Leucobacter luti TaxID=340320 RepID=UPI0010507AFD|nr:ABC transporter permease [Leucobacter luti]MCW2288022.1 ABC-2 type transport system permease protein [Leucobacter luti]TCK45816.1 ABC-2 type transport system permease protein [Leucobacter luti]
MTSTILIDASSAPESGPPRSVRQTPAPTSGHTFGGVFRSERIKFTSLRSIRLTLLITVVCGLAMSTLIAALWSGEMNAGGMGDMFGPGDAGLQGYLLFAATMSAPFLALVFGVLGVFAISSEYSSGMILSTLTAVPKRGPVYLAKAVLLAVVSGLTAAALVLGGLGIAVLFYPPSAAALGAGVVISGALGTIAYLVLISLFAFGIAALLRSTAGGVAVVAGVTFVLPIVFQVLSITNWDWVGVAMSYLPTPLGSTLASGLTEVAAGPSYWGALIAMLVWAAVTVVPAAILFQRRDAR